MLKQAPQSLTLLVPLLAIACGPQGAPSATRTISGSCVFTFWLDDGSKTTGAYCKDTTVSVFGRESSGGWAQVGTTSVSNLGFLVDAPSGSYLLGVKYPSYSYWEFFETARDRFLLDDDVVGRQDALSASSQTIATFNLSGLDPWDGNDYLELTSSGGATFRELVHPTSGATSLQDGATSASVSFDWYGSLSRLPDGTRGDVVYLHQDATHPIPGTTLSYQTATRFAQLPSTFAVGNGTTQSLDVALTPAQPTGSLSVDWRASTFEQYQADINPNATAVGHFLLVDANPHTLSGMPHLAPGTPDMVLLNLPPGTADQNFVGLPYGQFLPPLWVEYRELYYLAALPVTAPGANSEGTVAGSIGRYDALPASGGAGTSVVTPPRSPKIGNADAFQSPQGVGTTPMVSWSPPALGMPTSYTLMIVQPVLAANGGTAYKTVAYLTTSGMSMSIPPGVLQPGTGYVAFIAAYVRTPETADSAPYRRSYPLAWASLVLTFTT